MLYLFLGVVKHKLKPNHVNTNKYIMCLIYTLPNIELREKAQKKLAKRTPNKNPLCSE